MSSIQLQRPDGAIWKSFQKSEIDVLLTARGHELLTGSPELETKLCAYLTRSIGGIATRPADGVRSFFGNDSNGRVYTLDQTAYGYSMLVKETNGHSMVNALDRLDRIKGVIDKQRKLGVMPGNIDVPDHYGVVKGPNLPCQYVLMQGIDSGINVRDIVDFDSLNAKERAGIDHLVGPVTSAVQDEVRQGYALTEQILHEAIAEETGQSPTRLLSDWHEGNVVLERLAKPIDNQNWAYWVIDQ